MTVAAYVQQNYNEAMQKTVFYTCLYFANYL